MNVHEAIFNKYYKLGYSAERAFSLADKICSLSLSLAWEESKHPRDHGKFSSKPGIKDNDKVKNKQKSKNRLVTFLKKLGDIGLSILKHPFMIALLTGGAYVGYKAIKIALNIKNNPDLIEKKRKETAEQKDKERWEKVDRWANSEERKELARKAGFNDKPEDVLKNWHEEDKNKQKTERGKRKVWKGSLQEFKKKGAGVLND